MPKAVIPGFFCALFLFSACSTQENKTVFTAVPASASGITFSNQLTESATQSIATYEYFYNGAGVAAGDLDGDGLPDLFSFLKRSVQFTSISMAFCNLPLILIK